MLHKLIYQFTSVTQSCLTVWDLHGLQHTRFPCPSPTPKACSNSCPSSQWCHPTILCSVVPFSSPQINFISSTEFPVFLKHESSWPPLLILLVCTVITCHFIFSHTNYVFFTKLPWWASLVAQQVKNPPAMWETWVQSLGWEDRLEKGEATHSSTLVWRVPWTV